MGRSGDHWRVPLRPTVHWAQAQTHAHDAVITACSDRITDELLTMMTDKNWKVRSEGLQKVTEILKEAKFVTANIGGLPEAIKARLSESNKNLVSVLLGDCASESTWIVGFLLLSFCTLSPVTFKITM